MARRTAQSAKAPSWALWGLWALWVPGSRNAGTAQAHAASVELSKPIYDPRALRLLFRVELGVMGCEIAARHDGNLDEGEGALRPSGAE